MSHVLRCLGVLLLAVWGCTPPADKRPSVVYTRPYYFPVEELSEGAVYAYHTDAGAETYRSHYWKLQTTVEQGDTFLIWNRYDPLFRRDQYIREWITSAGVVIQEYYLYAPDSTGQLRPFVNKVEQNVVFPFYAETDSNLVYRFSSTVALPPEYVRVQLLRDRRFLDLRKADHDGRSYAAIAFQSEDYYDLDGQEQGGFWEQRQQLTEVYAEGIGLIEEVRQTEDGGQTRTYLHQRYSLSEFEALKAADPRQQ